MWNKVRRYTEEDYEFVIGDGIELTHQQHRTMIRYSTSTWSNEEGFLVGKPSIRLSINFNSLLMKYRLLDEIQTNIFSPSALSGSLWFQSSDKQLIAYFFNALLRIFPDFSDEVREICFNLKLFDLSCAYTSLPTWLYVRGEYERTFFYTPRQNHAIDTIGLLKRDDLQSLAVKIKVADSKFASVLLHMKAKKNTSYCCEIKPVINYIVLYVDKDESKELNDFLSDLKEVAPELTLVSEILFQKFRDNFSISCSSTSAPLLNRPLSFGEKFLKSIARKRLSKDMLDRFADSLLRGDKNEVHENEKICEALWEKVSEDKEFFSGIVNNCAAAPVAPIRNRNDLKYYLMRTRYYDGFVHDYGDKFKDDHIALLLENLPDELRAESVNKHGKFREEPEAIESLRRKLLELMETDYNGIIVHACLMMLSKYWPVNKEDPISLEEIAADRRIFICTGHQFDSDYYINYHHDRSIRYSIETISRKKILNPITNTAVFPRDDAHIRHETVIATTHETLPNFIPFLYGLKNRKHMEKMSHLLKSSKWGFEKLLQMSSIMEERCMRLHENMSLRYFSDGLATLINHNVSATVFMDFDTDKQILLTTKHWLLVLFISGVPSRKIISLSVENLTILDKWLSDHDFLQGPTIGEGWPEHHIIDKVALRLVEQKIDQLQQPPMSVSNKVVNTF